MTQNHVIRTVTLQVRAARQADGFVLQQDMSRWFWDEFIPVLDAVLTELAPDDELIRLDKLDIVVPALPPDRWRKEITAALAAALRERLERVAHYPGPAEAASVERLPVAQSHFDAWLFFLQNGQFPPRYAASPETERRGAVLENVAANAWAVAALLRLLHRHAPSLQRLVYQHDTVFLTRLAEAITGKTMSALPARQAVLFAILTDTSFVDFVKTVLKQTGGQTITPATTMLSARQFEVWFWQETFAALGAAPQDFDLPAFEESFFKHAFSSMLHIPFGQLLKIAALPDSPPRKGATPRLRRLENILRKAAKGDAMEAFLRKEINVIMQIQAPERAVSDHFSLAPPALHEETTPEKNPDTPVVEKSAKQEIRKDDSTLPLASQSGESPVSDGEKNLGGTTAAKNREDDASRMRGDQKSTDERKDTPLAKSETPAATESREKIETSTGPGQEVLYVHNAGLVLLHPFLSRLFEATGIIQEGAFTDETARARGVQLLYYLAVGDADAPEYELTLPKLLCGMAFDTPLDRQNLLNDAMRHEGDTLLKAVIKHWGALGAVSNDSLRQGFLQRDGKLSRRDGDWLLQVESKTLDILMGRLPWGIGIIKLKWMPDMVHVEWY